MYPRNPVHLHGFAQFKAFYTLKYKALGSSFDKLTDAETTRTAPKNERVFPWSVGWFTLAGLHDGKYQDHGKGGLSLRGVTVTAMTAETVKTATDASLCCIS